MSAHGQEYKENSQEKSEVELEFSIYLFAVITYFFPHDYLENIFP